ncbi:hypothetical protein [Scytonema hofmannii]|uniref:hypothetical protein n=1 Tax=Scytonema hofmannii TaxID=34078 RepID=UPI00234E7A0A|nr:hypothetical protein [Scytonema hofmannii]
MSLQAMQTYQEQRYYSPEEYLQREEIAEYKSEYKENQQYLSLPYCDTYKSIWLIIPAKFINLLEECLINTSRSLLRNPYS